MPTPAPATRTPPARPWPNAGPSTRAGMPGPVVSRTAPTPTPAGRTPAPSSSASSTSTPPTRQPADHNPTGPHQNMRAVADLEEQGEHDTGQGSAGAAGAISTPRTKTVCTEVSSDAEWIWRATAEDVLPTPVAAGAGRPDSSSRLAGASAERHHVSGYDGKQPLVTQRDYPSLLARSDRADHPSP